MRSRSAISTIFALVLGALAVVLARGLMTEQEALAVARPNQIVVVAARPIPFGAPLASDNLRELPWPSGHGFEGGFASIADLTRDGRRLALAPIQPNEPILVSKVTAPNGRATLSTLIEDGMRAVSVRVDEIRGVAGFVLPGDRVDVVLTRGEAGASEAAASADLFLQNAKVLAVDQLANDRQDKPTIARAVTLEVSVKDAQRVILAQGVGRLSLVLRQTGERTDDAPVRVTASDLGSVDGAANERVLTLERKLEELNRRLAAADARPREPTPDTAAMEARIRAELLRSAAPPPQQVASPPRRPVVGVIRNGSKREEYAVFGEP